MDIRINKLLSSRGVCSRREADRLTEEGRVTADGTVVATGQKVAEDAYICIDGKAVGCDEERVLIAYNKPAGVVCTTTDRFGERDIVSAVGFDRRIYPVGRLDKASTGLIFLTNDGELMNELTKASGRHEKEYIVKINKPVTDGFLEKMRGGIYLEELGKTTAKCKAWACEDIMQTYPSARPAPFHEFVEGTAAGKADSKKTTHTFRIILIQGLNRQIRRMCEACGTRVLSLKRVRIMNVELGSLPEGEYRIIEGEEYEELRRLLGL